MTNDRIALQHLWWKELRQLLPLVTMLPMLVILLLVFHGLTGSVAHRPWFHSVTLVLCLGMPGLFACGAGAMLVGYEKELRTLGWLTSLPIAARRIVRVKLLAAVVCLAALWILSFVIYAVASDSGSGPPTLEIPAELTWLLNSLFVLLAGFALAWRARSALVALLWVVPVAGLPLALAYGIDNWILQAPASPTPRPQTLLACQALGVGVAWWLTERLGQRALAPQPTSPSPAARYRRTGRGRSIAWRAADARQQPPMSALIWQFARQSRAVLFGISALLAVAVLMVSATIGERPRGGVLLAAVFGLLAISWLGVTTFQSDAKSGRIRFLSDRGISPRAIWLTRHAVPVGLLTLFVLLLFVVSTLAAEGGMLNLDQSGLAMGLYALMAIVIYLTAQWVGQVVFSPVVSAIAAPLTALAMISYVNFAVEMLATPWWLGLLMLPIPAIATLTMTRRWMDRRLGFSYWASHLGFLAAVCLPPAIPLLVAVVREPAMPPAVAQELEQVARNAGLQSAGTLELVLGDLEPQEAATDSEPASKSEPMEESFAARLDDRLDDVENQLRATNRPVGTSSVRVIEFLRSTATLARLRLDSQADSRTDSTADDSETATALRHYRRAMELLLQIGERMRLSPQLIDQDTADLLEIWLLSELQRDQARERLGQPLYEATARMLGDRAARRQARMRAIALSWREFQAETSQGILAPFGGYQPQSLQEESGTLEATWLVERRVGRAVADLWELAQGGAEAATPERLERIADFWGYPRANYGIGPTGPYKLDRFLHPSLVYGRGPASQWYADWERLAAELSP